MRYLWITCALALTFALSSAEVAADPLNLDTRAVWSGSSPELLLVEVIHNGQAAGSTVIARDTFAGEYYVDVAALADAIQIDWQPPSLDTPAGSVDLPSNRTRELEGRTMAPAGLLGELLASDLRFDPREYTLVADTVWPREEDPGEIIRPGATAIEADVAVAPVSLSEFRTEVFHRRTDDSEATRSLSDVGGTLGSGLWRFSVRDWVDGEVRIEDYRWLYPGRDQRLQIGHQRVSASPLLGALELTGAQYAWTNRPDALFTPYTTGDQLTALPSRAVRTIRGEGPPGGRAELRIEGEVVATTLVALDGAFEFRDVTVPGQGSALTEVWLFERDNASVPVTIKDYSGFFSRRLLPGGAVLGQFAAGRTGNWIESDTGESGGLGRAVWAPVDGWNIEAVYQHEPAGTATGVGTGFMAGPLGYFGFDMAEFDGDRGWRMELENRRDRLFWRGLWRKREAGWRGSESELDDRFAEIGAHVSDDVTVSLIGRDYDDGERRHEFVKPAVSWQPGFNLQLRARPDFRGDYNASAYWRPRADLHFNAYHGPSETGARGTWELNRRDQLSGQILERNGRDRLGVIWERRGWQVRQLGLALGAFHGNGEAGFLAQASYQFIPGLSARAEVLRDPLLLDAGGEAQTVVSLNLVANFAVSSGGLTRGGSRYRVSDRGTVTGRIHIPGGYDADLSGLTVLIDQQPRGKTEAGGSYTVRGLRPGIYEVSLDPAGLPVELSGQTERVRAEVGAGGATRVDFQFVPRFGMTGRVIGFDGDPVNDVSLQVLDDGEIVAEANTDRYGTWRTSGLPSGEYAIVIRRDGRIIDERSVMLEQEWLMDLEFRIDREEQP